MMQTETLDNNGSYAQLVVNVGKLKAIPKSLLGWIDDYEKASDGLIHVLRIVKHPDSEDNQKFTILFTFNMALDPESFEEYANTLIDDDFIPILLGHKIEPVEVKYTYLIPELMKGIGTGGALTIIIKVNALSNCLVQILTDVFLLDEAGLKHQEQEIKSRGAVLIWNCVKTENQEQIKYIMDKFNFKYELCR